MNLELCAHHHTLRISFTTFGQELVAFVAASSELVIAYTTLTRCVREAKMANTSQKIVMVGRV